MRDYRDNIAIALCAIDYGTVEDYQDAMELETMGMATYRLAYAKRILSEFMALGFTEDDLRELLN